MSVVELFMMDFITSEMVSGSCGVQIARQESGRNTQAVKKNG